MKEVDAGSKLQEAIIVKRQQYEKYLEDLKKAQVDLGDKSSEKLNSEIRGGGRKYRKVIQGNDRIGCEIY